MSLILPPMLDQHRPLGKFSPNRSFEVECLKMLCEILDDYCKFYDTKYWIDWGTLLGAYREKKIIDGDLDIDVSCWITEADHWWEQKQVNLIRAVQKEFFIRHFSSDYHLAIYPRDFQKFQMSHIDIYFHRLEGNQLVDGHKNKIFRRFYVDELETTSLYDQTFPCPRHTKEFLTLRYGADWQTPQPHSPPGNMGKDKEIYTAYTAMVGDMFHIGHLNLLQRCKNLFDKVIVGVHNDEAVVSYKSRPVIPYPQRLEIIRSCKYVDEVLENAPAITTDQLLDSILADFVVAGREDSEKINRLYPVRPERLHLIRRTEDVSSSAIKEFVKSV